MYVKRGSFTHDLNEATFRWRLVPQWADNGVLVGTKRMASITGRLTGVDASALKTAGEALEAAYSVTSGDFVLLQNDGSTETHFKITGSQTIGGIRCTRIEYPQNTGGDWTTYLNYELDIEADFGGVGIVGGSNSPNDTIISWTETLNFRGTGGPRWVVRELRNGPPQIQQVSQFTPIYASQRGEAVGLYQYPSPPAPIYPQHEMTNEREINRVTANSVGQSLQQQRQFRITWSYTFQAPGYITGQPRLGY